jgi:hypothetical protein
MKKAHVTSPRGMLAALACILVTACTTGTDVTESTPAPEEQARLERIAQIAHRLVEGAKKEPQKPASALVEDLVKIMNEAEPPAEATEESAAP